VQVVQPGEVPPPSWYNADFCAGCLKSARTVSEVLEAIGRVTGNGSTLVGPADVIPERTRPRRPA
jgi:hypothetical protein